MQNVTFTSSTDWQKSWYQLKSPEKSWTPCRQRKANPNIYSKFTKMTIPLLQVMEHINIWGKTSWQVSITVWNAFYVWSGSQPWCLTSRYTQRRIWQSFDLGFSLDLTTLFCRDPGASGTAIKAKLSLVDLSILNIVKHHCLRLYRLQFTWITSEGPPATISVGIWDKGQFSMLII